MLSPEPPFMPAFVSRLHIDYASQPPIFSRLPPIFQMTAIFFARFRHFRFHAAAMIRFSQAMLRRRFARY